jgi:hypothetical protein
MKIPRYQALIVEQQTAPANGVAPALYKTIIQVFPGTALRAYHYRQALNEGQIMASIWGDAHPVRVRAMGRKGKEDVLTLEQVESIGRALYEVENK